MNNKPLDSGLVLVLIRSGWDTCFNFKTNVGANTTCIVDH
jgi:hypothetical protein